MLADSAPGDTLAPGLTEVYTAGGVTGLDGDWTVVEATADGDGSDHWSATFRAPTGQVLTAGTTYTNVTGSATASHGALGFQNPTYEDCGTAPSTEFTVHEITATTFAATFAYRCNGATGTFFGYIGTPNAVTDVVAVLAPQSTAGFPDTPVGQTSATIPITITSSGSIAAHIASVSMTGASADEYSIDSETCTGAPVAPGGTCTVNVEFHPTLSGLLSAEVAIDDDTQRGSRTASVRGTATTASSSVSWSARKTTGSPYAWSWGLGLARTETSSSSHLHTVSMTDRVKGAWAGDKGPYVGVIYGRGNSTGTTWGTPYRVNPTNEHGDRAVVAASGKFVYAAWVRLRKWVHYSPTAPRTLYLRRNTKEGAKKAWKSRLALTSSTGRVDFPAIAAAGSSVYVAYTDSGSGSVRLAISHDHGATWTRSTIGTTSILTSEGHTGLPTVGAVGANVVVAWLANDDGDVVARVSTNSGASWSPPDTIGSDVRTGMSATGRDATLAVAWTATDGARVRTWSGGVWNDLRKVGDPYGSASFSRGYEGHNFPAVALGGAGRIGVAWSACWLNCDSSGVLVDMFWAESEDGGATWFGSRIVADSADSSRHVNDAAAIVWPTSTRRIVLYNGYRPGTSSYRMYLRSGVGAP